MAVVEDTTGQIGDAILLYDIYGERTAAQPKPNAQQLEQAWHNLLSHDAQIAFQSICLFIQHADIATAFLKTKLKPILQPDAQTIRNRVIDLGDRNYHTREAAHQWLANARDSLLPMLKELSAVGAINLEAQTRLDRIINMKQRLTQEMLRALRAVEVLEECGGDTAIEIFTVCSKGAPLAMLTVESQRGLKRIKP